MIKVDKGRYRSKIPVMNFRRPQNTYINYVPLTLFPFLKVAQNHSCAVIVYTHSTDLSACNYILKMNYGAFGLITLSSYLNIPTYCQYSCEFMDNLDRFRM